MSAYLISQIEVLDEESWGRYRSIAQGAIAQYGGRYLVRGERPEVVEGDWTPPGAERQQIVVVEFPDSEKLHAWYASPEYAQALVHRDKAVRRRLIFVDGVGEV